MRPTVRHAHSDEADDLTTLCMRSKAFWGYDDAFLEACRDELSLTPERMQALRIAVAEIDGVVVGTAAIALTGQVAELERLFVDPRQMREGVGRCLFEWACAEAARMGATVMVADADPSAAPFYVKMGAVQDGWVPSGFIPGRRIPKFEIRLSPHRSNGEGLAQR